MRGLPFDRKVEALLLDRSDVALIVRPMLIAWRQLREQIAVFDKAIRELVRSNSGCRLLMSVPGIGVLSALAYVSTVDDPARFSRSRSVGAHLGLTPRQYQSGEIDRSGRISNGVVTSLKEEHENSASRIFSSDRDCLAPHVHSRRAKGSVRPCGSEMTLDVESVVGGCVS
jgi:transposase